MLNHLQTAHKKWGVKTLEEAIARGLVLKQEEGSLMDPDRYFRLTAMADRIMKWLSRDAELRRLVIERLKAMYPNEL